MRLVQKIDTRGKRQGFTLVEVMIALTVVSVAVYMLSSTITATMAHSTARKERTLSVETAMNVLERMRAVPFEELYLLYNDDPDDDPDGPGTGPGATFQVPGLEPREGQQATGFVVLPSLEGKLRENLVMPELSLPRDLNGDLIIDAADHAEDYRVLPVQIRVEWRGASGDGHLKMSSMFSAVQKQL
ncbi:MAG: prepilin-type N-terminal cleavage/methylation domain-containing protein [Planctomycetota bacterium]|nr:prepilin-type N-terminal cleavage/methylation domain-containing protein [Planctomycetota bacterium]